MIYILRIEKTEIGMNMPYRGFPKNRFPTKDLERSRIMEIAPDIWKIEGYIGHNFLGQPPSCNIFVLRDEDLVVLLDTGTYPYYRKPILDVLQKFKEAGAKSLVLVLTQGHFDHVANNDVILESGYDDVRFVLPEVEYDLLDLVGHWHGEFEELRADYYNPYAMLPLKSRALLIRMANAISTKLASRVMRWFLTKMFTGINTLRDRAEILILDSREKRTFGDVEFLGWQIGRFFIVHDGTHSPGHCSLYDPKNKLFLTGDATLEINPAFFNSSMNKCIEMMGKFRRFAEQGFVELATDAHRSSIWSKELQEHARYDPLSPLQLVDLARGQEECVAYYSFFGNYYSVIKNEVLVALSKLGEATVKEIIKELKKSEEPEMKLKIALKFPEVPSRLDILVAFVLKETNAPRRKVGKKILFKPPLD